MSQTENFTTDSRHGCGKGCQTQNNSCLAGECASFLQMRQIIKQYLTLCANTNAKVTLLDGAAVTGRLNALYPAECGDILLIADENNVVTTAIPICQIAAFAPTAIACINYLPTPHSNHNCCNTLCMESLRDYLSVVCRDVILQRNSTALASGEISANEWGIITVTNPGAGETEPTTVYVAADAVSSVTIDN